MFLLGALLHTYGSFPKDNMELYTWKGLLGHPDQSSVHEVYCLVQVLGKDGQN